MSRVPRMGAVAVVVGELEASVAFYRRLGVPFSDDAISSEHGHAEATLPGGIRFMLDSLEEMQKFDTKWSPSTSGEGRTGIGIVCESPGAVDELYAALMADGIPSYAEPWDAFWGERFAQVRDPDGNIVALFAPLQSSGT